MSAAPEPHTATPPKVGGTYEFIKVLGQRVAVRVFTVDGECDLGWTTAEKAAGRKFAGDLLKITDSTTAICSGTSRWRVDTTIGHQLALDILSRL